MGSEFILSWVPAVDLTKDNRVQKLRNIIKKYGDLDLDGIAEAVGDSANNLREIRKALRDAVDFVKDIQTEGDRDWACIDVGLPYDLYITGGPSWGDHSEQYYHFLWVNEARELYEAMAEWALEDTAVGEGLIKNTKKVAEALSVMRERVDKDVCDAVQELCAHAVGSYRFALLARENGKSRQRKRPKRPGKSKGGR
jgi:hypothetical protein